MTKSKKPELSNVDTGEVYTEVQLLLPCIRHPMARPKLVHEFIGESQTHQSHAESCDINRIMRQYSRTGVLPDSASKVPPQYGDVTALQADDLTTQIERARAATREISKVRKERLAKKAAEDKELLLEAQKIVAARKASEAAVPAPVVAPAGPPV